MTDRELLELAAKAAGLTVHAANQASRDACGAGDVGLWISNVNTCWNPLLDDGDALRLAVRLQMQIDILAKSVRVLALGGMNIYSEGETNDAATRRAIVRAAAEVGKEMT